MLRLSKLILSLALLLSPFVSVSSSEKDTPPEMVAVVSSLSGNASVVTPPEKATRAVHLFDWLPAGSVITVDRNSRLTLAYANGSRYEMEGKSKATLSVERPKILSGAVHPLEPVPPIPLLASISASSQLGARSGAIRMRGDRPERISNLYPRLETTALPDSTVLRFSPIPEVPRYRILLEDEAGNTIFKIETQSAQVPVPAGVLTPGARYYWEVWSMGTIGPAVRGESEFVTLSPDEIKLRTAFKAKLENKGDAESLALLAEVDRYLGLLIEARDEFRAALAKSPSNSTIRQILEKLEKALPYR